MTTRSQEQAAGYRIDSANPPPNPTLSVIVFVFVLLLQNHRDFEARYRSVMRADSSAAPLSAIMHVTDSFNPEEAAFVAQEFVSSQSFGCSTRI